MRSIARAAISHGGVPKTALIEFFLPRFGVGLQAGVAFVQLSKKPVPAVLLNGLVKDLLHGPSIVFGQLLERRLGLDRNSVNASRSRDSRSSVWSMWNAITGRKGV